ncbi:MAG: hypothetical protein Q8O99_06670 [bacterium]|nr:hypothetical protein [bacterium]
MLVEGSFLIGISVATLFFLVGVLFLRIGLQHHYTYHQHLEKELNNLFLIIHNLLSIREQSIYRFEKAQEI